MSTFRFEAADASGRIQSGVLDADSARLARASLRERGLTPLAVVALGGEVLLPSESAAPGAPRPRLRRARLRTVERALLMRQLASLVEAGLPLAQALTAAQDQAERPAVRDLLAALRADVLAGHSFAAAMERHPRDLPDLDRALVAAGEQSGELAAVLARLADQIERRAALAQKVQLAFAYPAIVTVVALLVIVALLTYVVPQVVGVFAQTRQKLPLLTRGLIGLSDFARDWGWLLLVLLAAAGAGARALLARPAWRLRWHGLLLRLPLVGGLVLRADLARFADTLAILSSSGVPILRALTAARDTMTNQVLRGVVDQAIVRVREGAPLSRALGLGARPAAGAGGAGGAPGAGWFPPVMLNLIASGERTGRLPELLQRAASTQANEFERRTLLFTSLLEPLLVLAMGAVVLLIVLAILLPIVEVNQLVR